MVDQIRAWLDLIPPEERKRWEWLDDPTTWGGMSRTIDTPIGKAYNPLATVPDVLGALGTAVADPISHNLLQPATGALFHAANRLPGGARRPFTSEAEVPLEEYTPEGLRQYLKANTEGSFLGELSAGILSDPLTFVGGPIGRVARGAEAVAGAARLAPLARGAGAVARADEAYVRAMGALVEGGLAKTGEFAKTLPVVGKLFQDSPEKALTAFQIESQRAERAASQALRARGLNWQDVVRPPRLDVKGTAGEWEKVKATWPLFDEEVAGLAHPAQQVEMLRLRQQAAETENLLNTRGEQSRIAVMEGLAEGEIAPKQGEAQIRALWRSQQKGVRALQIGLFDALEAVKAAPPDTLGAIDDPTRAAITSQIGEVAGAIRGFHDDASQVGLTLRGGLSRDEGDRIAGIFSLKDPQQRIVAMQAQDLAYRTAYDKTVARLDQTVFDLEKKYGSLFDADSVASVRETLDDTFRATQDLLAPATQPIEQTLTGLGGDHRQVIMNLWQHAPLEFPKALNRVMAVRDRIAGEAEPVMRRWYEEAYSFKNKGRTLAPGEIDARVDKALESGANLLRDPAMLDPANAGVRKQIETLLTKYARDGGDVLNADHTGRLAMSQLGKAQATELGITGTPPWFSPLGIMLGAWKELALMSPRFHFANVIGQLLLSEADGVSSGRVATMQARKLRQLATTRSVDDAFDATVSPGYAAWRDTGDEVWLPPGVAQNMSDATMLPGTTGPDTHLGRIPFAIRAGVPALATGGAAYAATPDDEDRTRNAMIAALMGGSFGAAAPRFARANRLLAQVTETGARGAAFLTGLEQAMGTLLADGKGTGLLRQMYADIPRLLDPLSTPVVGKRLTPLGADDTITTMQQLYAPGVTRRGTPAIAVRSSERLGAATTIGEDVDVAAVQRAFAEAGGRMSPDALADLARKAGATEEQALRLRAGFDDAITQAETVGIARSNKIHFDYSDVNNSVQWLRKSGVSPFAVWTTKAMPVFTKILLQHPGFIVAINELNDLSDTDAEEAGLTSRFARMARLGELGTVLAEQVLGRADGTVMANVLGAVFPYSEVGAERSLGPNANPLEHGLAALQSIGLGPSPLVTLPLMAAGATGELPPSLFRTSAYLGGATQAVTGVEADPEMLTKRLMRGARTLTGAEVEPTVTGDFLKDRAIRQRIAETAVEETGGPPKGPYLLAMDDPASQIWQRAQAQVERQRTGQTFLGAVLPTKTRYLGDTEAEVRRIREATGVGPAAAEARRIQRATPAELAAAEAETRRKPLTVGETLEERAAQMRWIAAENAAAGINPLARTLNNLGGNQALGRQFPEFQQFQRRIRHMSPKRKGQLMAEYLGQRPALREYIATHNIYG